MQYIASSFITAYFSQGDFEQLHITITAFETNAKKSQKLNIPVTLLFFL